MISNRVVKGFPLASLRESTRGDREGEPLSSSQSVDVKSLRRRSTRMLNTVGIFEGYQAADAAINQLRAAGLSKRDLSAAALRQIVLNRPNQFDQVERNPSPLGPIRGAAIDGLMGLLIGVGAVTAPNVGPVLVAGRLAPVLEEHKYKFKDALVSLGLKPRLAEVYQRDLAHGSILVIAHTAEEQIFWKPVELFNEIAADRVHYVENTTFSSGELFCS